MLAGPKFLAARLFVGWGDQPQLRRECCPMGCAPERQEYLQNLDRCGTGENDAICARYVTPSCRSGKLIWTVAWSHSAARSTTCSQWSSPISEPIPKGPWSLGFGVRLPGFGARSIGSRPERVLAGTSRTTMT